ncbi:SAM-dependent methyltransferase TehB [Acinetobacter towneri]|uniref:SAM-dependent methyltransferase TehB n=1 Tax=Acinetobacter towneri TaxID=202956 RepID=UPI002935F956|nr:SAM-dependent methyltransferase TehB [Acinetobacter towneri]MDV2484735.1 SAM-dependent methyltransferase TehB [Acinetobacter towneri]
MQQELICYKQLPIWNHDSIPQGFKKQHNTQVGTWAKLTILKGELHFSMLHESGEVQSEHIFSVENQPPFIEPQAWHKIVSASDDIECQLSFYCLPQDYFVKKYKLSPTHSEILMALPQLTVGKALDVGCGTGRNALYLSQNGFQVDAWDVNPVSIQKLNEIIAAEQISSIQTAVRDFNQDATITGEYDFINCIVVMMFLAPETIPPLIQHMQQATKPQGFNLIVCAMNSKRPLNTPSEFIL